MNDDYLYDRSGSDPEVERLESLLSPFRHDPAGKPPDWEKVRRGSRVWKRALYAVAAIVVLGLAISALTLRSPWAVRPLEGVPLMADRPLTDARRLQPGAWVETDQRSKAAVRVGRIGQLEVAPGSRLRAVATRWREHRMEMNRGSIHATIWAPPRLFFVETPSGEAIDYGCEYDLTVDANGRGELAVQLGLVLFQTGERTAYVVEGTVAAIEPGRGAGSPIAAGAPESYRDAVALLDRGGASEPQELAALQTIVSAAGSRDLVTLWHLLDRVGPAGRMELMRGIESVIGPIDPTRRAAVIAGERQATLRLGESLEIVPTPWWAVWR